MQNLVPLDYLCIHRWSACKNMVHHINRARARVHKRDGMQIFVQSNRVMVYSPMHVERSMCHFFSRHHPASMQDSNHASIGNYFKLYMHSSAPAVLCSQSSYYRSAQHYRCSYSETCMVELVADLSQEQEDTSTPLPDQNQEQDTSTLLP